MSFRYRRLDPQFPYKWTIYFLVLRVSPPIFSLSLNEVFGDVMSGIGELSWSSNSARLCLCFFLCFLCFLGADPKKRQKKKNRQWNLPAVATSVWNTHLQVQPIKLQLTDLFDFYFFTHVCVVCVCVLVCMPRCVLPQWVRTQCTCIYYICMQGIKAYNFCLIFAQEYGTYEVWGEGWWIKHVDRTCFLVVLT